MLALRSGRIDPSLGPDPDAVHQQSLGGFADGTHRRTLDRWGLADEVVGAPVVDPRVAS